MISSRWPRPTFVIESIPLMPVCSGSFTGCRAITPGALNSSGRVSFVSIGPCPSSGLPSGSTTRPSSASPTGTLATRPVRRNGSLSRTCSPPPRSADVVLLEVEREPDDAVLEVEHLHRDGVLEPVDARDAVADLQHRADLRQVGLDVVLLDPRLEDLRDLFGAKLQGV